MTDTKPAWFRFIGTHAEDLVGGRVLDVGEYVELTPEEQENNKRLIDEGKLIPSDEPDTTEPETESEDEPERESPQTETGGDSK